MLVAPNTKATSKTKENKDKMLLGKEARGGIVTGSYTGYLAPVFVTGLFAGCLAPVFVTGSFAGCLAPVFVASLTPNA